MLKITRTLKAASPLLLGICTLAFSTYLAHPLLASTSSPPYKIVWERPSDLPLYSWDILTYDVSGSRFNYSGAYSAGSIDLKTGRQVWEWQPKDTIISDAVVGRDITYCAVYKRGIVALSSETGKVLWNLPINHDFDGLALSRSLLFFELHTGKVAAVNVANRRKVWETQISPNTQKAYSVDEIMSNGNGQVLVIASPRPQGAGGSRANCISERTGRIIWTSDILNSKGVWPTNSNSDQNNLYVAFSDNSMAAVALRTGKIIWKSDSVGDAATIDGDLVVSTSGGDVTAVSKLNGYRKWSVTLSEKNDSIVSPPVVVGSDVKEVSDGYLYSITSAGKIRWRWPVQDAATTYPIWIDDKFLLPVHNTFCLFSHGVPFTTPTDAASRAALASKLAPRLDNLSIDEKHRLLSLGGDAIPALCTELKRRMNVYSASGKFNDYSKFSDCADDIRGIMKPEYTQVIVNLLPFAHPVKGDESVRQELIGILADKGDPKQTLPMFLRILKSEKPNWGYRYSEYSTAVEVIRKSSSPEAVQYLISAISDTSIDPQTRHMAYVNAAHTGSPEAVKAIESYRNNQLASPSISDAMDLAHLGIEPNATNPDKSTTLLAAARDKNGQLWGLVQSGLAGSDDDLWIVKYNGMQWTEPILTSLTQSKLGHLSSFIDYVDDAQFTRDTDGDGWTDLLERRLGTDPSNKDTDNDGLLDSVDKNPLTGRMPQTETERVLAAAFEAHFWYPTILPRPCLITFPKGIEPFQLCGANWVIIGVAGNVKSPLAGNWNHGTAFVDFYSPMYDFSEKTYKPAASDSVVLWNADHTRARVLLREYYGGLNGAGSDVELRKFGSDWIVVHEEIDFVS